MLNVYDRIFNVNIQLCSSSEEGEDYSEQGVASATPRYKRDNKMSGGTAKRLAGRQNWRGAKRAYY